MLSKAGDKSLKRADPVATTNGIGFSNCGFENAAGCEPHRLGASCDWSLRLLSRQPRS
jgi:hypothetical protein